MKQKKHAKAGYVVGWISDMVTQYFMKYGWKGAKLQNFQILLARFKVKIQPKGRNQRSKYRSEIGHFRQIL